MTDEQITALAREYAEDGYFVQIIQDDAEEFLRWLLRRYFLVEKSKAEQFFKWRQNILANQNKYDRYIVDEASAEKRLMLCIFPDLGKEVEG